MVSAQGQEADEPGQGKQPENPVGNATRLEPGIFAKFTACRSLPPTRQLGIIFSFVKFRYERSSGR